MMSRIWMTCDATVNRFQQLSIQTGLKLCTLTNWGLRVCFKDSALYIFPSQRALKWKLYYLGKELTLFGCIRFL